MRLGVAWYPEQHPETGWAEDVRRMREGGLSLVRVGEFAWAWYEPARGRLDLAGLARAVDIAAEAGLEVIVGTPTSVPPVWLAEERPEILSVGPDGRRRQVGSRRHGCPTAPAYREESARITAALVDCFGHHEAVVAWQLDNEIGNHDSARCWCDACREAFAAWLEARYKTVDRLNAAWGTAFWSQAYPSFASVPLPVPTMTAHAPSLLLNHRRFASAQAIGFLKAQRALVAAGAPGRDILANEYFDDRFVDPRAAARVGGIAAIDAYPDGVRSVDEVELLHDLAVGHTGRAWVMEAQAGPINWTPTNPPVSPGQARWWGWLAAMHGHDAYLVFSWQPARSGQEQYHSGLLRHDGTPDRGYGEMRRLAAELAETPTAILVRPPARVAVTWDAEDAWAIEISPHRAGLTHADLVLPAYTALRRLGLEVDVVTPTVDLTGYAAVVTPALHLATPARLARLRAALNAGVLVVLGSRALVVNEEANRVPAPLPAGLAAQLGARVEEMLSQTLPLTVVAGDGSDLGPAGPWTDVLSEPEDGGEVLARYGGASYLDGAPAAVRRGTLVVAGFSAAEPWRRLLAELLGPILPLASMDEGELRFERDGAEVRLHAGLLRVDGVPDRPNAERVAADSSDVTEAG